MRTISSGGNDQNGLQIKEYTIAGFLRELEAKHSLRIHRNTISRAIKRSEIPIVCRPNGRGGVSRRIRCSILEDMINPITWLGSRCSPFSERYLKHRQRVKDRFEFGDVHNFVFAFTHWADEIPKKSYGPMTLRPDYRDDVTLVSNGPTRVLYQIFVTERGGHEPIRTNEDFKEAVEWVKRLPEEVLGREEFPKVYVEHLFRLLQQCTNKQRERVLEILRAYRQILREGAKYSEQAIAQRMGIHRTTLCYHKKSNPLAGTVLKYFSGADPETDPMKKKKAFENKLSLKQTKRKRFPHAVI